MTEFILKSFDFVAQFTGGRDGVGHLVNHGIGAILFSILLSIAIFQRYHNIFQRYHNIIDREKWLVWGFGLGLTRELLMVMMAYVQTIGLVSPEALHVVFPPLEHALSNMATVVIAAAFLRYLLDDVQRIKKYLVVGLAFVLLCYLATFWWWAQHITSNPASKFGLTWCDWLFRINASIWMLIPLVWLLRRTKGWVRNTVCLALTCFFLNEFLKIPDMALGEVYENIFAPIRHGLYILAIPMFGYVYLREMYEYRQQMEKDLRESQRTFETVFNNSIPMCITSKEYDIIHANDAYYSVFSEQSEGKIKCYESRPGPFCHTDKCPIRQILQGEEVVSIDSIKTDREGNERHYFIAARPFLNANGELDGLVESFQDITERKAAEHEKEVMEAKLAQSQRMEAIGTLAGGIAHDFNNILSAIIAFTELAKDSDSEEGQRQDDLNQVLNSTNRAQKLVEQILVFSRHKEKEKKPLRIQQLIKEVLRLLRASIPASIDIQQHIDQDCGTVLADPTQMSQVLMNLCTNAVHAMDEKGVLEIRLQEKELNEKEIRYLPDLNPGRYVMLTISDTGQGMDNATAEKIFDPFFTTKEVGEGTGLGLSVVHGIVQSHRGMITVESEPGKGTIFHVYFPRTYRETLPVPEDSLSIPRGDERILFVDDEKEIVISGQRILSRLGYRITPFTSSVEALEKFKATPDEFDLVITDQAMPKMTGLELIKELLNIRPDIPIIICSGYSSKISPENIKDLGIKGFVAKPIDMRKYAKTIRMALGKKK